MQYHSSDVAGPLPRVVMNTARVLAIPIGNYKEQPKIIRQVQTAPFVRVIRGPSKDWVIAQQPQNNSESKVLTHAAVRQADESAPVIAHEMKTESSVLRSSGGDDVPREVGNLSSDPFPIQPVEVKEVSRLVSSHQLQSLVCVTRLTAAKRKSTVELERSGEKKNATKDRAHVGVLTRSQLKRAKLEEERKQSEQVSAMDVETGGEEETKKKQKEDGDEAVEPVPQVMNLVRSWSMPHCNTFSIKTITHLMKHFELGPSFPSTERMIVVDPFARNNNHGFATQAYTNDLNPETSARYHMDAVDFLKMLKRARVCADVVLLDPPYSARQVKDMYSGVGIENHSNEEANLDLYEACMNEIHHILKPGGLVFTYGWRSRGFPSHLAYKHVLMMTVAHGGAHHDTMVVVEQKPGNADPGMTRRIAKPRFRPRTKQPLSVRRMPPLGSTEEIHYKRNTFEIPQVRAFLGKFLGMLEAKLGRPAVIVDPFAGTSTIGDEKYRNDLDPNTPQPNHKDAVSFVEHLAMLRVQADVVIMDPPPTPAAVSDAARKWGSIHRNQPSLYRKVKDRLDIILRSGGYAVSIASNSQGFGSTRGYRIENMTVVSFSGPEYDIVITTESKRGTLAVQYPPPSKEEILAKLAALTEVRNRRSRAKGNTSGRRGGATTPTPSTTVKSSARSRSGGSKGANTPALARSTVSTPRTNSQPVALSFPSCIALPSSSSAFASTSASLHHRVFMFGKDEGFHNRKKNTALVIPKTSKKLKFDPPVVFRRQ